MKRIKSNTVPPIDGALIAALLALFGWMAWSGARNLGQTVDEAGHITSGYITWRFGDARFNAEGGILSGKIISAPLLTLDLNFPERSGPFWHGALAPKVGYTFFFESGNDYDAMLRRARLAVVLVALLLPWLIWRWAHGLFGLAAGRVAIALAVVSPTLLAHAGLATADMLSCVFLLAALTAWWGLLQRATIAAWAFVCITSAATLLAKMSGVLLLPFVAMLIVLRGFRSAPLVIRSGAHVWWLRGALRRWLALVGLVWLTALALWGLMWAAYGFRYAAVPPGSPEASFEVTWSGVMGEEAARPQWQAANEPPKLLWGKVVGPRDPVVRAVGWARNHRLLPEPYLWGFLRTYVSTRSHPAFLNGQVSPTGWWYFFPVAFLLKSTPAELLGCILSVIALVMCLFWSRDSGATARHARHLSYRAAPLLILFIAYWAVAINTPMNIGHRHLLPIYPVVFVAAGGGAAWALRTRPRIGGALLALMLIGQLASVAAVRPFYLSYFSELVGGIRRGWHYLVDSSYDWGQGLPQLNRWIASKRASGNSEPVFLTYFGTDSPAARHLDVTRFADFPYDYGRRHVPITLTKGWYAISATYYQRVYVAGGRPWTNSLDQVYADTWAQFQSLANRRQLAERERGEAVALGQNAEMMTFERLCYFLKYRQPEDVVGGSILVFHLTEQDVDAVVHQRVETIDARRSKISIGTQ